MRVALLLLLLLAGASAGCISGGKDAGDRTPAPPLELPREDPSVPTPAPPRTDLPDAFTAAAPAWSGGDWWNVSFNRSVGGKLQWGNFTAVVVEADAQGRVVGAADNDTTYRDALLEDLLMIGTFGPDLSPTWNGQAFPLYRWPLADGATWNASWQRGLDESELLFRAALDRAVETPIGPRPGFRIAVTDNGTLLFDYTYVPALGWLTHFEEFDENGNRVALYRVLDWGSGFAGPVYTIQTATLYDHLFKYEALEPGLASFMDGGEHTYLWLYVRNNVRGLYGHQRVTFVDPSGDVVAVFQNPASTRPTMWAQWKKVPSEAGEWQVVYTNAAVADMRVLAVGVTDVSRGGA